MVRAAPRSGQHMIYVHYAKGEMRLTPAAHAFLLAVEPVAVRPVVGEDAKVRAYGRGV